MQNIRHTAVIPDLQCKHVLVAEDNSSLRQLFSKALRVHFDVRTAMDGEQALNEIEMQVPDLLVLDINMPQLSGMDVLSILKQKRAEHPIKIMVVTGNGLALNHPGLELADVVLMKPVSIFDLTTLAQRLLQQ